VEKLSFRIQIHATRGMEAAAKQATIYLVEGTTC
jgi:hypothetical protein